MLKVSIKSETDPEGLVKIWGFTLNVTECYKNSEYRNDMMLLIVLKGSV